MPSSVTDSIRVARRLPPRRALPGVRALRYWRRNLDVFLATWKTTVLPPILEPLLYLVAFGAGVGMLIGTLVWRGREVGYMAFVAPGMICVATMFWAFFEATYSTFVRIRYQKTIEAVMSTPLTVGEIIGGEILWAATKGTVAGLITATVVALLGLLAWPDALWIPAVLPLGGLVFAGLGVTACALITHINTINVPTFLFIMPMFLFSGTFFPLDGVPPWAGTLARLLPLTHLVEIVRGAALGDVGARLWLSAAVLAVYAGLTVPLAVVLMKRKLIR